MKPRVTVLLGAGHSQGLGLPGTAALTSAVDAALLESRYRDVYETLASGLRKRFGTTYDFELVAAALEIVLVLAHENGLLDGDVPEVYSSDIWPHMVTLRQHIDPEIAHAMYRLVLRVISQELMHATQISLRSEALTATAEFYAAMRSRYELDIATLNYDLTIDGLLREAVDGFAPGDPAMTFDSTAFLADDGRPRLAHLHGALDHSLLNETVCRYKPPSGAAPEFVVRPDRIVASSLITGGDKPNKLTIEPYSLYHAWFAQRILSSPRVLIVGYGSADQYLNAWILAAARRHGEDGRFVIVDQNDGRFPQRTMALATFALGETIVDSDYFHAALWGYGYQDRVYVSYHGFPPTASETARIVDFVQPSSHVGARWASKPWW